MQFYWNKILAYEFSCEVSKSFRNTYLVEHLRTAVSVFHHTKWLHYKEMEWFSLKWLASQVFSSQFHFVASVLSLGIKNCKLFFLTLRKNMFSFLASILVFKIFSLFLSIWSKQ